MQRPLVRELQRPQSPLLRCIKCNPSAMPFKSRHIDCRTVIVSKMTREADRIDRTHLWMLVATEK